MKLKQRGQIFDYITNGRFSYTITTRVVANLYQILRLPTHTRPQRLRYLTYISLAAS